MRRFGDADAEALAKFLATHGVNGGDKIAGTFTDLAALLAQPDLGFAIGALRTDEAVAIYPQLFAAGKHLLAEKPLGRDSKEAAFLTEQKRVRRGRIWASVMAIAPIPPCKRRGKSLPMAFLAR